jgi:hypothetical protein
MTSNQRGLYGLGDTHATMAKNRGLPKRKLELIPKNWPKFRLKAETRLHEAGIASNRRSAMLR